MKVKWLGISLVFDIGVFNIARSLCPFLFEENTTQIQMDISHVSIAKLNIFDFYNHGKLEYVHNSFS